MAACREVKTNKKSSKLTTATMISVGHVRKPFFLLKIQKTKQKQQSKETDNTYFILFFEIAIFFSFYTLNRKKNNE